jgi:hypothetical protein
VSDTADADDTAKYTGDASVVAPASGVTASNGTSNEAASFPNGPTAEEATSTDSVLAPVVYSNVKVKIAADTRVKFDAEQPVSDKSPRVKPEMAGVPVKLATAGNTVPCAALT